MKKLKTLILVDKIHQICIDKLLKNNYIYQKSNIAN